MPLLKPALILKIYLAFKSAQTSTLNLDAAQLLLAEELASAIDMYIKSATIIIPPGIPVATAGSPAAQAGASTAPSPPAIIT